MTKNVSAALGMFYFPSEIVPDSNELQLEEQLVCGDLDSVTAEFACDDLGGDATCVPTRSANADTGTAGAGSDATEENAEAVSERSLVSLEKCAGAACNKWTL